VLHPESSEITASGGPGRLVERLGQPLGAWGGFVVEQYEAPGAASLTVSMDGQLNHYRMVSEPQGARLVVPEVPPWLAAANDAAVAFEHRLPVVVLPPAPDDAAPGTYLQRWRLSLRSSATGEVEERSADLLAPSMLDSREFAVKLEDLVPGPDVGDWDLDVIGPLGRGLSARLSLLPEMEFDVDERPGVAGPQLEPSRVFVKTRDGIHVLEEADSATPARDGWLLHDLNRNGRIPFTVQDARTGREATAVIRLSTVQWRWIGAASAPQEANLPQRFALDDVQPGSGVRLLASNPGRFGLRLTLVDSAGRSLQSNEAWPTAGRGAAFEVHPFLTTATASAAVSTRLRLGLIGPGGEVVDETDVGLLTRSVELLDVRGELLADHVVLNWSQTRSFPGTVAELASVSRPWAPPMETDVQMQGQAQAAIFEAADVAPGRYRLTLWHDDGWVGRMELGAPTQLVLGTPTELDAHAYLLPPTAEGTLELALLSSTSEKREAVLRLFAAGIGPHQLADLTQLVARTLGANRAQEVLELPWSVVANALAAVDASPSPMLEALAEHAATHGLGDFCVAIGLDRWPALYRHKGNVADEVRRRLWSAWLPLGALLDLPSVREEPFAGLRCEDMLGYERLIEEQELEEAAGQLEGHEFVPDKVRLRAIRTLLSPLPGKPFDPDGWLVASLAALEAVAAEGIGAIESERDTLINTYRVFQPALERSVAVALKQDWLPCRSIHPDQHPWAFLARMSLATALARRLLARNRTVDFAGSVAEMDALASWLERRLAPLYERDLCFAELVCCAEFDWR
jgi:hypothetical protein